MPKFLKIDNAQKGEPDYTFDCPGCGNSHGVWVNTHPNGSGWSFNGDVDSPTVTPSILVQYPTPTGLKVCHSFVTNGKIQYLNDCTHQLAGQTIELPQI